MTLQLNADVMKALLLAINQRSAQLHIVKVKSHHGVTLNEVADQAARLAVWRESEAPNLEVVVAATTVAVFQHWVVTAQELLCKSPQVCDTIAVRFLTEQGQGLHLLTKLQRIRAWTAAEEPMWLQLVTDVYPNNAYLRLIDKHGTQRLQPHPTANLYLPTLQFRRQIIKADFREVT
eukprot:361244-Rhodomonas_salina.1